MIEERRTCLAPRNDKTRKPGDEIGIVFVLPGRINKMVRNQKINMMAALEKVKVQQFCFKVKDMFLQYN